MTEKRILKAYSVRSAYSGSAGDPIDFVASTEGIKRDGKSLDPKNWNFDNYLRNPVFLFAHDYMGRNLPIGRTEDLSVSGPKLSATVRFDQEDEFAQRVEKKYRRGYMNAVSVGWLDMARCKKCDHQLDMWAASGLEYYRKKCPSCGAELTTESVKIEYDLLDISAVPVPGDPDALMERAMIERSLRLKMSQTSGDPFVDKLIRAHGLSDDDRAKLFLIWLRIRLAEIQFTERVSKIAREVIAERIRQYWIGR